MQIRPNPDNQIAKLKEQVSWIKSYYCLSNMEGFWNEDSIIYRHNHFLIQTDDNKSLSVVFCNTADIEQVTKEYTEKYTESSQNLWIVIEDFCPKSKIEKFLYANHRNLVPLFLDVRSQIEYNEIVNSVLDGIDWRRSLESGDLTFEWD